MQNNEKPIHPLHWLAAAIVIATIPVVFYLIATEAHGGSSKPAARDSREELTPQMPAVDLAGSPPGAAGAYKAEESDPLSIQHEPLDLGPRLLMEYLPPRSPDDLIADDTSTAPTLEGLLQRTVDWWDAPYYDDEDNAYSFWDLPSGDGSLSIGELYGRPTREDCEQALKSQEVQDLLGEVCELENIVAGMTFNGWKDAEDERAGKYKARGARLAQLELDLMAAMERSSGYKHWAEIHRRYMEWWSE